MKFRFCSLVIAVFLLMSLFACGSSNSSSSSSKNIENSTAIESDKAESSTQAETFSVFITSSNLNVRSGPGTSYDVVNTVSKNAQLQLTGEEQSTSSGSNWYEVIIPETGEIGWVSSKYGIIKEETGKPIEIDTDQIQNEKDLKQALSKLTSKEDKVQNIIYYMPSTYPKYTNTRTYVLPYIATKDGKCDLHIKVNYFNDNWVFWNKLIFAIDDYREEKTIGIFSSTQDVANNGVVESYDFNRLDETDILLLQMIAESKETIIRFQGNDHYYDYTVPSSDKKAINQVLDAYFAFKTINSN